MSGIIDASVDNYKTALGAAFGAYVGTSIYFEAKRGAGISSSINSGLWASTMEGFVSVPMWGDGDFDPEVTLAASTVAPATYNLWQAIDSSLGGVESRKEEIMEDLDEEEYDPEDLFNF